MERSCNLVTLSDATHIRSGFTFRGKVEEVSTGDVHVVQIKDVRKIYDETNSFILVPGELPMIKWDGKSKAFLEAGDILLPARGEYSRAFYLAPASSGEEFCPVVASSQFLVLSIKMDGLFPEYLCWALNQSSAQNYLNQESRGSNISMLSVTSAGQLKIPVPSVEVQKKIIQINRIWEREQQLLRRLISNRENMLKGMYSQLLAEKNK